MAELTDIQGVSEGHVELLSALGVEKTAVLAQSDPGGLLEEMKHANARLHLAEQLPDLDELIRWIEAARKAEGQDGPPLVKRLDEVVELVQIEVLTAHPVKKESIIKSKISVGDVPIMDEFLEEKDLYVEQVRSLDSPAPESSSVRKIAPQKPLRSKAPQAAKSGSDPEPGRTTVEPLKRNAGFDIRKTASPKLNEGKKLHSRSYVRGVLHPQPFKVKSAAFVTMLTLILFPLTFVAGGMLLLFKDHEHALWLAAVPVLFIVFALLHLMMARSQKCRICGQPLFTPKACGRHMKAHRVPLLGYILPTSIHMLLFHWFRCIYCGTSVRLKE